MDLKTSHKDYKIVFDKIEEADSTKYVSELKLDKDAKVPGDGIPKGDEHKKKFEAEPKEEDQEKLKQKKPEPSKEFKIEEDAFDDADVAEHIKTEKKEKEEKLAEDKSKTEKKKDEPIKSTKDLHEEIIKTMKD
jgi:hypothetical protein